MKAGPANMSQSHQQMTDATGGTTNGNNNTQFILRCTFPGCRCSAFKTNPLNVRQCIGCSHGYVPHAFDQLGIVYEWDKKKIEPVNYNVVFDIASLVLYGTTGIPFRLHACLYRLVIQLHDPPKEMTAIAAQFDWTWDDFCRGFKIMDSSGTMLSTWNYADLTDETMILMHFLKYLPTQAIAEKFIQELLHQKKEENPFLAYYNKTDSGLQMFFSQNQVRPVMPPATNGMLPGPPVNGFHQLPVIPNGRPMTLSSNHNPPRPGNAMNGQEPNGLPLNGGLTTSLLFRTTMQNGALHLQAVHPGDMNQSHNPGPSQPTGSSNSNLPSTGNTKSQPAVQSPPQQPTRPPGSGKRTLKPKPAAAVASSAPPLPAVKVEPMQATAAVPISAPFSPPAISPTPTPKKPKLEVVTPPEAGPSGVGITTNGKHHKSPARRVYCDNCQKSFCDKGALKIHYSAVHLKEMHRCTTKGCNMMFSSRRSRNRHSSNPNQRLHSNLFAPRRGGILLNDGEMPPLTNEGSESNDRDDLSDGEDDRSMSYDEVANMPDETATDLSTRYSTRDNTPQSGVVEDGKLVMALEDGNDLLDQMEVDGHEPITVVTLEKPVGNGGTYITASLGPLNQGSPPVITRTNFVGTHSSDSHHCSRSHHGSESTDSSDRPHEDLDDDVNSERSEEALDSEGAIVPTANRDEQGKIIVPTDPENASRCMACGKVFKNHFTVRTHYVNVHLRILHACTVSGCRQQFPSVRSRDRHSANINLHSILEGKPVNSPEVPAPVTITPAFIG